MRLLLSFVEDINNWTLGLSAFLAALVIIFGSIGKCRRGAASAFIWVFLKRRRERDANYALIKAIDVRTSQMDKQMKDNGGNSIRDIVIDTRNVCGYLVARARHEDDLSEDAKFELDASGELIKANCAFCTLMDADEKDLLHLDYIARIHTDDRDRFEHELGRAIQNRMPLNTQVKISKKGGPITVVLDLNPDNRSSKTLQKDEKPLRGFFAKAEVITT